MNRVHIEIILGEYESRRNADSFRGYEIFKIEPHIAELTSV